MAKPTGNKTAQFDVRGPRGTLCGLQRKLQGMFEGVHITARATERGCYRVKCPHGHEQVVRDAVIDMGLKTN